MSAAPGDSGTQDSESAPWRGAMQDGSGCMPPLTAAERERIMIRTVRTAVATVLVAGSAAAAAPILHFDVNGVTVQATNNLGVSSSFGGLSHTGSLNFGFSAGISTLEAIEVQQTAGGT